MARDRQEYEGSVLVVDEASMVSTAEMELLMRVAERFRAARLVLVGDRRQLRAVSAGELISGLPICPLRSGPLRSSPAQPADRTPRPLAVPGERRSPARPSERR